MLRATVNQSNRKQIAIIGAGLSGLRCADVLLQHGHNVTILEARNRIGGRVAQSNALGHEVDLGANWIHGTIENPMFDLAQKTGTELHDWDEKQLLYDVDSKLVPAEEAAEYSHLLWEDGLIAEAFRHADKHKDTIPKEESLFDFFTKRVKDTFKDLPAAEAEKRRLVLLNSARVWGAYVGTRIERQSLRFYWLEECIEGENPFVAGTYRRILDEVAKHALSKADIKLNTRVTSVEYNKDEAKSTVTTSDGGKQSFDEVVVTVPLGYLKRNKKTLLPGLAPRIDQAMDNLSYGNLDKVYLDFHEPFWLRTTEQTNGIDAVRVDAHGTTPNVRASTMPIHQANGTGHGEKGASLFHWLSPEYDPKGNPDKYDFEALDLTKLPGRTAHPTLLFYIYGECSRHIAKMVEAAPTEAARKEALINFFKPYLSLLPGYSAEDPVCTPKAALATAWAADELAGYGSYCNFQVGLEEGDKDIEAIREGMPERGLWFAGEHVSPFVALGTTTGAYWAGQAVGERIVQKHAESSETIKVQEPPSTYRT